MGAGAVKPVDPNAWRVSEEQRGGFVCLFCGGESCKSEDWRLQKEPPAIRGLHSSWITDDIVAMQRPSSRLLREHGVLAQFQSFSIGAIINLQETGEHPHCGDGNQEGGFAYRAEEVMDAGVFFYNFGWLDMSVPTLDLMMRIVQVISFTVSERRQKVAVHCHAGLGRTGLVIACWLIYELGFEPERAVALVRSKRPGSIQTRAQAAFCSDFSAWCEHLRRVYVMPPASRDALFSLQTHLQSQRLVLHGADLQSRRRVPKCVGMLCERLRASVGSFGATPVAIAFIDVGASWSPSDEANLINLKRRLNAHDWYGLDSADVRYLAQLLLDWFDQLAAPVLSTACIEALLETKSGDSNEALVCIDQDTFGTLEVVVQLLALFRHCRPLIRDRVYMRWALALSHSAQYTPHLLRALHPAALDGTMATMPYPHGLISSKAASTPETPSSSFIAASLAAAVPATMMQRYASNATVSLDKAETAILELHPNCTRSALARSFFVLDSGFSAAIAQSLLSPHTSIAATPMVRPAGSFSFPTPSPLPPPQQQTLATTSEAQVNVASFNAPYNSILENLPKPASIIASVDSAAAVQPVRKQSISSLSAYLGADAEDPINKALPTPADTAGNAPPPRVRSATYAHSRPGSQIGPGSLSTIESSFSGSETIEDSIDFARVSKGAPRRFVSDPSKNSNIDADYGDDLPKEAGENEFDDDEEEVMRRAQNYPPLAMLGTRPANDCSSTSSRSASGSRASSASNNRQLLAAVDTAEALSVMSNNADAATKRASQKSNLSVMISPPLPPLPSSGGGNSAGLVFSGGTNVGSSKMVGTLMGRGSPTLAPSASNQVHHQAVAVPGIPSDTVVARLAARFQSLIAEWDSIAHAYEDAHSTFSGPSKPTATRSGSTPHTAASLVTSPRHTLLVTAVQNRALANAVRGAPNSTPPMTPESASDVNSHRPASPPLGTSPESAAAALLSVVAAMSPKASKPVTAVQSEAAVEERTAELLASLPHHSRVKVLQKMLATMVDGT